MKLIAFRQNRGLDFVLCLKRAATTVSLRIGTHLSERFVLGLESDNLKKRLFTESSLTLKSAVEIFYLGKRQNMMLKFSIFLVQAAVQWTITFTIKEEEANPEGCQGAGLDWMET